MKPISHPAFSRLAALAMLALASLSCETSLIDWGQIVPTSSPGTNAAATATPAPMAETTFNLTLPAPVNPGESVAIGILDEVTGLGLNSVLYPMTAVDAQHYSVTLPLALSTTVKYKYYRQSGLPAQEDTALGMPVRYRLHTVSGPAVLGDLLASWSDQPFNGPTGRIAGAVLDSSSGHPAPNILVTAGGVSTLTDSLGQYALEGLPEGTHTLIAYAMDGAFTPFEQGASVQNGLTTTAPIALKPAPLVQVTFIATLPKDTVGGAPVRLAGNLLQLGNSFADLDGGISVVASRTLTLTPMADGRYSVTEPLPVGTDIRYKYTLGDGFWNAEHDSAGSFVLRQLIVPPTDTVVQDTVSTWQAGPSGPIFFDVTVPANTPSSDTISIQFNPYGWTEAIPMWPLGGNRWVYKLYGPLDILGSFHYRYCRNDQCGFADDVATAGLPGTGRSVSTSLTGENRQDTITAWAWWPETEPVTLVAVPVKARQEGFWAGVEFQNYYRPNWQALYPSAMQNVQALGANYLVLAPSWTATSQNPLVFAPTPGSDPLWSDMVKAIQYGHAQNMSVAIHALPRLLPSTPDFWQKAARTPEWWNSWFDRYRAFALYHADLAAQSGAQALILGGNEILPALPGGTLPGGSSSNVPADAETRWRNLLTEVRQRFNGKLLWAHAYGSALSPAPAFIDQVDAFYLLWSAPLATSGSPGSIEALTAEAGRRLDADLLPFLQPSKKPVVIVVDYPSAQGAAAGCVPSGGGGCLDWSVLFRPYPDTPSASLDMKGQADLYQAMLQAINQRDWIGGFISRGYYPPVSLMDKSSSVRSKMAADLLWYWLPRLTGVTK